MRVAVHIEYKADRKEPFGALLRRIADAFESAGLQPTIMASFSDGPVPGGVSAIDRALKKHPELKAFDRADPISPGGPAVRRLTNAAPDEPFPIALLLALADGMPRSLPFHIATGIFAHEQFGDLGAPRVALARLPGVIAGDSWWVNGRNRHLSAVYMVEGDSASKTLRSPPPGVSTILAAFGKPRKTAQYVVTDAGGGPGPAAAATGATPAASPPAIAVGAIVARYRAGMAEMVGRLNLPHDLPPFQAALGFTESAGPLKPTLAATFGPRGYDCRGETGAFTLRRRTPDHHVVEFVVDVGTWSRLVTPMYRVHGPGFRATVPVPVAVRAVGASQYPIGDHENWERIVANLAVIVDELDRTLLPEIEAAVGRAPDWFEPGR